MTSQAVDRRVRMGEGGLADLATIFSFALFVRLYAARQIDVLHDDGPTFLALASRISEGDWSTALGHAYHPLYPILIAAVRNLTGDFESAALVCSMLGGGIATVGLFLFLRNAFDLRVAWIGGLIFASTPYAVRFTSDVASEGVYLACFLLGVAALYRALVRESWQLALAAGALSGLAYLVRPEGMGLVIVGTGLAALRVLFARWSLASAGLWIFNLVAGFGLLAGPYLWAIQSLGDSIRLSRKKSILMLLGLSDREGVGFVEVASDLLSRLVDHGFVTALVVLALLGGAWGGSRLRRNPATVQRLQATAARLHSSWIIALLVVAVLAGLAGSAGREDFSRVLISTLRPEIAFFCALGLVFARRQPAGDRGLFIAVLVGAYLLVLLGLVSNYGYLSRRHAVPVTALLLGYAATGVIGLAERLRAVILRSSAGRLQPSLKTLLAIVVAFLFAIALPKSFSDYRRDDRAQRLAAEWLRENRDADGKLAAHKRRFAYYAGRDWVPLYQGERLRDAASLHRDEVRFIVVDDKTLRSRDGISVDAGLSLREIYRVDESARRAFVYEWSAPSPTAISSAPSTHPAR